MFTDSAWRNEFGSLMRLEAGAGGWLKGLYRSTTGASGDYPVVGFIEPGATAPGWGRAMALAISWRQLDEPVDEDGTHWVSGLCGQLMPTAADGRMTLLHNLVVSTSDTPLHRLGFHLDKLGYEATTKPDLPSARPDGCSGIAADHPLSGSWALASDESRMRLELQVTEHGEVLGTWNEGGIHPQHVPGELRGFTDWMAPMQPLRSVTLCGWSAQRRCAWNLSGWLEPGKADLHLLQLCSYGTEYGERYLQTQVQSLHFHRPGG